MGRFLLLLVALTAAGGMLVQNGARDTDRRTAGEAALAQRYLLAERGAAGGLSAGVSRVARDFTDWRAGYPETRAGDLVFTVDAEGPAAGPVRLTALGSYGDAQHRVETIVSRLAEGPAALVLDADTATVSLTGTDWAVSGVDARAQSWLRADRPTEGTGYGAAVRAVRTRTDNLDDALRAALGSTHRDQVRGIDSSSDTEVSLSPELTTLAEVGVARAQADHSTATPRVYAGGHVASPGTTFGTPDAPVAVHVDGDFVALSGDVAGHGLLVVDGDFRASGQFEWHGVVIVRGANTHAVSLAGQAAVYGAMYVLHESGYALGDGFFPFKSAWAVEDLNGVVQWFVARDDTVTVHTEGALAGMNFDTSGGDRTDVEGWAFMPDGAAYLVDNQSHERAIYRISPDQFDGDAATAVNAVYVGQTGRNTDQDEVTGLAVKNGVLYGLGRRNRQVYRIDTATGQATTIRTFSADPGATEFLVGGLSLGPNGTVYTNRLLPDDNLEMWRFDSFPSGDPVLVGSLGYRPPATSRMGAAFTVAPDGTVLLQQRTEVRRGHVDGGIESVLDFVYDVDAMEMFWEGEGGISNGPVPSLDILPWRSGYGSYSDTVPWSNGPDVTVSTTFSVVSGTPESGGAFAFGSTFQEMRASADLGGAVVTAGAADYNYVGPDPLPTYRLRAGAVSSGGTSEYSVTLDFDAPWDGPFYLYVMDLDFHPLTISARDAAGLPLSTATWTKDTDMDVLGAADIPAYTWSPDGSWANPLGVPGAAQLAPPNPDEKELSFIGIRIPSPLVRSITLSGTSPGDWVDQVGIAVSQKPLFVPEGTELTFSMSGSAQILHSAESIGKLAVILPEIESESYVIDHDRFGRDLPRPTMPALPPVPEPEPDDLGPPARSVEPR